MAGNPFHFFAPEEEFLKINRTLHKSQPILRSLVVFGLLVMLSGSTVFAGSDPVDTIASGPVWPSPPQTPRVAYIRSIAQPADAGIRPSAFRRLGNWIIGSRKGNEPFLKPFGLAVDEDDNLCLTDTGAAAVGYLDFARKKWSYWTTVGSKTVGTVKFVLPVAIAKHNGVFYVADSALGVVVAFNEKGKLLFKITGDLVRPTGLAVAGERLYVADSQRHCVEVFGLNGQPAFQFGKRGTGAGEFNFPTHIAADQSGHVLVTDSINCRVEVFDLAGHFQKQIGAAGDGFGQFSRPKGVAVDAAGHLYVVDAVFDNIQIFTPDGQLLLYLGEAGSDRGQFWLPNGIAISRGNKIYISDVYNHRIQVLKYLGQP
jgi:sugar lactone lactonase YvrE